MRSRGWASEAWVAAGGRGDVAGRVTWRNYWSRATAPACSLVGQHRGLLHKEPFWRLAMMAIERETVALQPGSADHTVTAAATPFS